MALRRSDRYPGRFDTPTANSPQGAFKNRSAPDAQDGSYLEKDWANDWDAFFGRAITVSGVTINGQVDTAQSSQLFDAVMTSVPLRVGGNTAGKLAVIGDVRNSNNVAAVVIKTTSNNSNFYRTWSDGMIEAWGTGLANTSGDAVISFPTAFPLRPQLVTLTPLLNSSNLPYKATSVMMVTDLSDQTKLTIKVIRADGTTSADGFLWYVRYIPV